MNITIIGVYNEKHIKNNIKIIIYTYINAFYMDTKINTLYKDETNKR